MAAQQNGERNNFEPPTYSQEIFATRNGSYKLFLQVQNFNGYVRVCISKQIWCEEANDYVHAKKGHCCFPLEACDALKKYLPAAKTEADRLDKQVNGNSKPVAFAGNGGRPAGFGASKLYQRRADAAPFIAGGTNSSVACETANQRPVFGEQQRRAGDYKTDGKDEEEANAVEQGCLKKLRIDEEPIVPQKTQTVERSSARR